MFVLMLVQIYQINHHSMVAFIYFFVVASQYSLTENLNLNLHLFNLN